MLLKCLGVEDSSKVLMGEIHEGVCGAHQSAYKDEMDDQEEWILLVLDDCFEYHKVCQDY